MFDFARVLHMPPDQMDLLGIGDLLVLVDALQAFLRQSERT